VVDAAAVRLYVRQQRRLNAMARAWLDSEQARRSNAPLGVATTLLEAMEDALARLSWLIQ